MKTLSLFALFMTFALSACQGNAPLREGYPYTKTATVNAVKWSVTPTNHKKRYVVTTDSLTLSANTQQRKIDQIQAVEMVTGCVVKKTTIIPDTFSLEATVKCKN